MKIYQDGLCLDTNAKTIKFESAPYKYMFTTRDNIGSVLFQVNRETNQGIILFKDTDISKYFRVPFYTLRGADFTFQEEFEIDESEFTKLSNKDIYGESNSSVFNQHPRNSFDFFQNKDCDFFPCHKGIPEDEFNCLFCFCPLYFTPNCGGNHTKITTDNGTVMKDCSECVFPHKKENYTKVIEKINYYLKRLASNETLKNKEDKYDGQ